MFLSRLLLNPHARQVQTELVRPYQMHKTIMQAFPSPLPAEERILFRVDSSFNSGLITLLVQSTCRPMWEHLSSLGAIEGFPYLLPANGLPSHVNANPAVKPLSLHLHQGQLLAFRLQANPTKKIKLPGRKNGSRVSIKGEVEQITWLERKMGLAGAALVSGNSISSGLAVGHQTRRDKNNKLTWYIVRYDGILRIVDPDLFQMAVRQGIGSSKAFGCGLLSLARP